MNKLHVYLPCYNEEHNIHQLTSDWLAQEPELKQNNYQLTVTIIDDKSTDNTPAIAKKLAAENTQVNVITHKVNQNLGGGLNTAVDDFLTTSASGDIMCIMDGDNTQKPKYIHSMLSKMQGGADCVIASRYQKGAQTSGIPFARRFLSDGAKLYYSMVLGIPGVKDYTCGYRIYGFDILKKAKSKYGNQLIEMKNFSCMMELLFKLHRSGAVCAEVPFDLHYDDKIGESKMKILNTVKDSFVTAIKLKFKK